MKKKFFAHPQALVDEGALIGTGSRIWAFAHVQKGSTLGSDCNICNHAFIESGAVLGDHVIVKNSVSIWEGVTAEDGVFFGPNCTLTNDMNPRPLFKPESKAAWLKKTFFGKGSTVGANATVLCGLEIGAYAFIAAGSVVTKDVPEHALVIGSPARIRGWVCECGFRLDFKKTKKSSCKKCKIHFEMKSAQKIVKIKNAVAVSVKKAGVK